MPFFDAPCLTPFKLAEIAAHPLPPAEELPLYAELATCIEPGQLARQEQVDGTFDQTEETEHFLLAWDASNTTLDTAALAMTGKALEDSWAKMVDELGWLPPDQTDSCRITVVLADLTGSSSGTGGWTNVNAEGGVPYMVINTDWYTDDAWVQTLLAHEFNHASQFAYNVFWEEDDWWYWESTAEWSTELPYPDANMWTYSLWSYLYAPYLALDSDQGLVNYGHFTLNVYLQENVAEDAPQQIWEAATDADDVSSAFATALGEPITQHLPAYTSHVAAMDVDDRDAWLATLDEFDVDPYLDHVTSYPAEGAIDGKKAPQGRGQNFLHLSGAPAEDVVFRFTGATEVKEQATDWALTLATTDTAGVVTHTEALADEEGHATVRIVGLGQNVADAWIGVIPLNDFGKQGASWAWSAKPASEDDGKFPDGAEDVACGCAGAPGAAGALVAVAGALLVGRRRR